MYSMNVSDLATFLTVPEWPFLGHKKVKMVKNRSLSGLRRSKALIRKYITERSLYFTDHWPCPYRKKPIHIILDRPISLIFDRIPWSVRKNANCNVPTSHLHVWYGSCLRFLINLSQESRRNKSVLTLIRYGLYLFSGKTVNFMAEKTHV